MKVVYKILYILCLFSVIVSCRRHEECAPVDSVSLDRTEINLIVGRSEMLTAIVFPESAVNKNVKWSSNTETVVKVDELGQVTGISVGSGIITVTTVDGGKTATCTVNVVEAAIGITIQPTVVRMTLETTQTVKAIVFRNDGGDEKTLVWMSGDKTIATVDSEGVITAVAPGKTAITIKTADGKYTATCEVTVIDFKIEYATIPEGRFIMGSPVSEPDRDADEIQHTVSISKGFRLSKYEITNAEYCVFLNINEIGANGKWSNATIDTSECLVYNDELGINYDPTAQQWNPVVGNENFPVVGVTWFGAMEFATWVGGSLPTEAQWEYACRGSASNVHPFGVGDSRVLDYKSANFFYKYSYSLPDGEYVDKVHLSPGTTQKVGSYQPNNWGLYDMHGNVWEWCSDWYDSKYGSSNSTEVAVDPKGPAEGSKRVLRGGSWYYYGRCSRAAFRYSATPEVYGNHIGFRVSRF